MKIYSAISLLLILILTSCATSRDHPVKTYYPFEYEGVIYEILGHHGDDAPANFLIYRVDDRTIFRAVDRNLDSTIDFVLTGDIDLIKANEIYREGIRQAQAADKFQESDRVREFMTLYEEYRLVIQTILVDRNRYLNRFTVFDMQWRPLAQFIDENGDGELNRMEMGEIDLEEANQLYQIAVERAADENRFESDHQDRFILTLDQPIEEINRNRDISMSR
ncbi:hypothetical protein DYD21_04315 [Rhodohalobacter sp. SW132]|uniref:hypothetical protein n=1 Tax=Rhodohalobacter sp. SW132 TaxID=2293433 RepID=UPI000E281E21|nr:hypothetical protein [Rhodohalobacter sp. SW132]REL39186.1 hypothetical protein DYD21_04315 [Rhodohalobacter sp. SW132]